MRYDARIGRVDIWSLPIC